MEASKIVAQRAFDEEFGEVASSVERGEDDTGGVVNREHDPGWADEYLAVAADVFSIEFGTMRQRCGIAASPRAASAMISLVCLAASMLSRSTM